MTSPSRSQCPDDSNGTCDPCCTSSPTAWSYAVPVTGRSGARDPAPLHVAQPVRREALHTAHLDAGPSQLVRNAGAAAYLCHDGVDAHLLDVPDAVTVDQQRAARGGAVCLDQRGPCPPAAAHRPEHARQEIGGVVHADDLDVDLGHLCPKPEVG